MVAREARGQAPAADVRQRLTKHVLSAPLAEKHLHSLMERDLSKWREGLPKSLASGTVRRIVNDLKAALNAAAVRHRARLPAEVAVSV